MIIDFRCDSFPRNGHLNKSSAYYWKYCTGNGIVINIVTVVLFFLQSNTTFIHNRRYETVRVRIARSNIPYIPTKFINYSNRFHSIQSHTFIKQVHQTHARPPIRIYFDTNSTLHGYAWYASFSLLDINNVNRLTVLSRTSGYKKPIVKQIWKNYKAAPKWAHSYEQT